MFKILSFPCLSDYRTFANKFIIKMETISINFQIPASWSELSDKQMRTVFQLIADDMSTDELKTPCLLNWSSTKVIGRQDSGSYLLKKLNRSHEAEAPE